jgi:HK97 family phage portal protein
MAGVKRSRLPDDPLDHLLNVRPNADMTAISFKESLLFGALTWGNGYAEISKNARGQPAELYPLLADRVVPRRRATRPYKLYYEYMQQNGERVELEPENVYHLRGPGITGLMGDNLVARAAKSLGLAAAQERFASTYFGNNTNIGGVLEHPKKLQPDAHKRLKDDWEDKYKGPFKANRPVILEEGMKWTPVPVNAEHAQLTQSRTFQVEEICRWFGVPPHKVQHLARATFNNIEHLGIEFVRDALTPWAKRMEQEADFKLFPQRPPWRSTKLDMGWLTHGDAKSRFEAYKLGRDMGAYSVNDILSMEGKNTIGKVGDVRIVPLNMTTLEQMMNGPPAPKAPSAPGGSGGDNGGDGSGKKDPASEGADSSTETSGADSGSLGNSLAREALLTVFASVFERYAKRLENREADLRRRDLPEPKIAAHLADEREGLRPWILDESVEALELASKLCGADFHRGPDVLLVVDEIDNGKDPRTAAEDLVARWRGAGTERAA